MTEVVSRWGGGRRAAAILDLKVICTRKRQAGRGRSHFMLAAYGIDELDVVWVREPVWLESLGLGGADVAERRPVPRAPGPGRPGGSGWRVYTAS